MVINNSLGYAGWMRSRRVHRFFDNGFPAKEQLPRLFLARFTTISIGRRRVARVFVNGKKLGDDLTDNAHVADAYRLHDILHLGFAAVLGWSPICRRNMRVKRKSLPLIDEVEDGGRAGVTEEGISQLVFEHAMRARMFSGADRVPEHLLRDIRLMVVPFEVSCRRGGDWERAILMSYACWRYMLPRGGGSVFGNMYARTIEPLGESEPTPKSGDRVS